MLRERSPSEGRWKVVAAAAGLPARTVAASQTARQAARAAAAAVVAAAAADPSQRARRSCVDNEPGECPPQCGHRRRSRGWTAPPGGRRGGGGGNGAARRAGRVLGAHGGGNARGARLGRQVRPLGSFQRMDGCGTMFWLVVGVRPWPAAAPATSPPAHPFPAPPAGSPAPERAPTRAPRATGALAAADSVRNMRKRGARLAELTFEGRVRVRPEPRVLSERELRQPSPARTDSPKLSMRGLGVWGTCQPRGGRGGGGRGE